MEIPKAFSILDINEKVNLREVKQAYRDLAKVWHPDRFAGDNPRLLKKAENKFKEINAAYEKIKEFIDSGLNVTRRGKASAGESAPFQETHSHQASAAELHMKGYQHLKDHCYSKVIEIYSQAILLEPENAIFYFNRGEAHFRIKDGLRLVNKLGYEYEYHVRRFREDMTRVIELLVKINPSDPDSAVVYQMRSSAHYKIGNYGNAVEDAQSANAIDKIDRSEFIKFCRRKMQVSSGRF